GPEMFIARHTDLDVVVCAVDRSYFALLAMDRRDPSPETEPFADAIATLTATAVAIRKEIG
ncbi:MAG: hypothetical protein NT062_15760, partial [Proteobacteria bacterium]|nr:hypothetical protein [Pseudomonadota bacterium]